MNLSLCILEISVVFLGLAVLLLDLWTPPAGKRSLGYFAVAGLVLILGGSFLVEIPQTPETAFAGLFVHDGLALFFKRLFLLTAIGVLLLAREFAPRIPTGISEFYTITIFALSGMMFAASANHFVLAFVALELIAICFYILTGFLRHRTASLEAGVKYLILGALSSSFLVYGMALVYGTAGSMSLPEIAEATEATRTSPLFQLGMLLILVGLGFKIAVFPWQFWAPDVYQGAPAPITAFLAIGSKAAGFALLLRLNLSGLPMPADLLILIAAATILYGNLCALPQRNLKRLLGYSGIAHAGYLAMGLATGSQAGAEAILFYFGGYLFTAMTAFAVITIVSRETDTDDLSILYGLGKRSPLLALAMALAVVSLAGIPPLAGFFGKFLLFLAVLEQGPNFALHYLLAGVAIVGVAISIYYYFGIIRAMYWPRRTPLTSPIPTHLTLQIVIVISILGMLWLGMLPGYLVEIIDQSLNSL